MERDYTYEGFNIRVTVQACASLAPRNYKTPNVGYTAVVTITRSGARMPVLPQICLSGRDGQWFSSVAETLFAAGTADSMRK